MTDRSHPHRIVPLVLAACLAAVLVLPLPAMAQQPIGSYFTRVNTYIYEEGPRKGRRHLVRPRKAFTVLDVTADKDDAVWYRIVYPPVTQTVKALGWTPTPPHEVVRAVQDSVLVFSRIPTTATSPFAVHRVPAGGLELLNESQRSPRYAALDWQKVRFQLKRPLQAWARGAAGIFRLGKPVTFLSRVYGEMVTRNVDKETERRLLSGVVRIGDTVREVQWALGDPLRSQNETIGNARRTIWEFGELTVTFENDVVKQIN